MIDKFEALKSDMVSLVEARIEKSIGPIYKENETGIARIDINEFNELIMKHCKMMVLDNVFLDALDSAYQSVIDLLKSNDILLIRKPKYKYTIEPGRICCNVESDWDELDKFVKYHIRYTEFVFKRNIIGEGISIEINLESC